MTGRLILMAKNSKQKFKITPADRDDPIFQDSPVIGGRGPGTSPANTSKVPRGRRLPQQYPWIDRLEDMAEDDPTIDPSD